MRCLSLTQPWASLVAMGAKTIETRSWSTPYRGPLAIHAAKGLADMTNADFIALCHRDPFRSVLIGQYGGRLGILTDDLPRGMVVAVCRLQACIQLTAKRHPDWRRYPHEERAFGDYTPGRYAWVLDEVLAISPEPARGQQGLWEWDAPPAVLALLEAAHASG